jgi:hypothetical protein
MIKRIFDYFGNFGKKPKNELDSSKCFGVMSSENWFLCGPYDYPPIISKTPNKLYFKWGFLGEYNSTLTRINLSGSTFMIVPKFEWTINGKIIPKRGRYI